MRQTSEARLSSNDATSFMAFFSSSETRIVTSQIFFSMPVQKEKARRWRMARPGEETAPGRRQARAERKDGWLLGMSGGLLCCSETIVCHSIKPECNISGFWCVAVFPSAHHWLTDSESIGNARLRKAVIPENPDVFLSSAVHD